ncbi:MAG: MerR family transcriptional regulator [Mycolicibacterium fortuitum]|uniref:MerR family transcriptional regulator n=1 Tax=Mycolicibacterium fortuitum TaxID=1766 RepID=UPI000943244B|nr:MerR family transcriptional regulator [Mycolicibacterium fortuitum]MCA4753269.1 MerR family transcriptional regulator [Mycolicibacterium fortuitum]NOR01797.1 MerR family transcriptional regulator [Mycolicibacterium fortuitum]
MNEQDLLSIGEFAARTGLSATMLRSYAASGLLVPAAVDALTGYRYYARAQVAEARTVALLRGAQIPVAEIAEFLLRPTEQQLAAWCEALDDEYARRCEALGVVRRSLPAHASPVAGGRWTDERTIGMVSVLRAATATDQGPVRATNQDSLLADGILYAVADGFGPEGDHASRIAVETLAAGFTAAPDRDGLIGAVQQANERVFAHVDASGTSSGATLTLVALFDDEQGGPLAVNIGDSPLNRIRDGGMSQLTNDHSVSGELVRVGEITREEARFHPHRHLLTRALGIGPVIRPDVFDLDCRPGDRLLISSDGLFAGADDADIVAAATEAEPEVAAQRLVQVANEAGGSDNTTVIVIDLG